MKTFSRPCPATRLLEIVAPRTNTATITAVENMLAALPLKAPLSLEIAGRSEQRRFFVRITKSEGVSRITQQIGAAYPQAEIREVDTVSDPALPGFDEQVAACTMTLRDQECLPIRTFRPGRDDSEPGGQADPILGVLAALSDLPPGWRSLAQLVLRPAPRGWTRRYRALTLPARTHEQGERPSLTPVAGWGCAAALMLAGIQGYRWYQQGDWLRLGALTGGALLALAGMVWLLVRNRGEEAPDPRLVAEKLSRPCYEAELRLALFAPRDTSWSTLRARLEDVTAAYGQYNLPAGNTLVRGKLKAVGEELRRMDPLSRDRPVLNTAELSGLWHLPQSGADVPLLERTRERRRLPDPGALARGCPVGVSEHQGRRVRVCVPDDVLERNSLLVAKTRRGKSSLMLHFARYLMERPGSGSRRCLLLVDPHGDLAREALGLVPPERQGDVVYLDLSNLERPFGLNLVDTSLWRDRDRAVSSALTIFNRHFDSSWGTRMEDAFRFALLTLYEANEAMCRFDPARRRHQYTLLDLPALYNNPGFRRQVQAATTDSGIATFWHDYERMERRMQEEVTKPVKTKISHFAGSRAGRALVGQPASTVDPADWVRAGRIVLVNTAEGAVGEGTSSLIGATIINLLAMVVSEQVQLPPSERHKATFIIDEFHAMPGADYEYILGELGKYGASLVLATQSLSTLESSDRQSNRRLRQKVFSNLDGLFAFHVSAEDARYLVPELGAGVDEEDLGELGNHRCYARLTTDGERVPAFSVRLLPPPAGDPEVRDQLATESAARYGRDHKLVDVDLRLALARVEAAERHATAASPGYSGSPAGTGVLVPCGPPGAHKKPRTKNARSRHRAPEGDTRQLALAQRSERDPQEREKED